MKPLHGKFQGGSTRPSWTLLATSLAAVFLLGACESLTLRGEPETARIRIDSDDVSEVTLVTSRFFVELADPDCPTCPTTIQLVQGDTSSVGLPFERTYPLNYRLQFFAEAYSSADVPITLSMTAYVDDREWYNGSRILQPNAGDGMPETLRFVYQYNQLGAP